MGHLVLLVQVIGVMAMTVEVEVTTGEEAAEVMVEIVGVEVEIMRVEEVVIMMEEVAVVVEVVLMEVIKEEKMVGMVRFLHLQLHLMEGLAQIICLLQMLMGGM